MKKTPRFFIAWTIVSLLLMVMATGASAAGMSGAIFTTNASCGGTNVNIFDDKADVYLDGGPAHQGAAGLPDGDYYVQVTEPNGTVLGKSNGASVTVSGGEFATCYKLAEIVYTPSSSFTVPGFDTTSNAGGEYKVWASMQSDFPGSGTKTDNFKVKTAPSPARLQVIKFYDANANGINDDSQPITGWKVNIADGQSLDRYTPVDILLDPDTYTVTEYTPVESNWMATKPSPLAPVVVTLTGGSNTTVEFGNLCLAGGGGLTLGFWSNKNGQALFGSDDLDLMVSLNLRNADGSAFDPGSYTAFRTWLLGASATNMAYMLSAQLAAMELNVVNGKVSSTSLVYAPGTTSANSLGFTTISALMAEANNELGAHGLTLADSPYRTYQQALKNALDNANNNQTFVQPTPCSFSFAS